MNLVTDLKLELFGVCEKVRLGATPKPVRETRALSNQQSPVTDSSGCSLDVGGSFGPKAYGRGGGVGRVLGVGSDLGVGVGRGVAVTVAVGVAVAVGVGVGVAPPLGNTRT